MKYLVVTLTMAAAALAGSTKPQLCAGLAGIQCPAGFQCVDNPTPDCPGGIAADCPGKCVKIEGSFCGGFGNLQCPDGYDCVDNPKDSCDPKKGGRDCGGICKPATQCGGFVGKPCAPGYYCYNYEPYCNDCFGRCVKLGSPCGGKTGKVCGKPLVCSDVPGDGCNPDKGGKDCPRACAVA